MPIQHYKLKPGMTLGRNYFIIDFLGAGWEGEVYKVEERRTGIMRPAKIFYEGHRLSDRQLKQYTHKMYRLRQCSIITQYHHRDIARVGKEQVELLVSDLADGEMLSTFLNRQPNRKLTPFAALHLLYALVQGIEPIHFKGEYHGDIHADNIFVKRVGLGFEVHLLDFFDLGRATRDKIQYDVYDLISLLYEVIGGKNGYRSAGHEIRQIVCGRRHTLIKKKFRNAGRLRLALENLEW